MERNLKKELETWTTGRKKVENNLRKKSENYENCNEKNMQNKNRNVQNTTYPEWIIYLKNLKKFMIEWYPAN